MGKKRLMRRETGNKKGKDTYHKKEEGLLMSYKNRSINVEGGVGFMEEEVNNNQPSKEVAKAGSS
jgi:hypothetical protein